MTIATTRSTEYTIGQLVTIAYRRAGLLEAYQALDATMLGIGQEELQLVCDALETRGLTSRATEFYSIDVTAGTSSYTLPDYCLAVVGSAMWIPDGSGTPSSSEQIIRQMSQEEWQTLTDKSAASTPSSFMHRRDVIPNIIELWPVPDADGTVRAQVQRLRADVADGSKTIDFERYWSQAIIYQLAGQLAINASMVDKGTTFLAMAEKEIERCMGNAREQSSFQMIMGHRTGWSRR